MNDRLSNFKTQNSAPLRRSRETHPNYTAERSSSKIIKVLLLCSKFYIKLKWF